MEERLKILFIINPGSGNHNIDWPKEIEDYFKVLNHTIEFYFLDKGCNLEELKEKIASFQPDKVVAVGGD